MLLQNTKERSDDMKKILSKIKTEHYLFIVSMFFLTLLGIFLSYNYNLYENYNLLFDSDTGRVILDATLMNAEHYRVDIHPLFIIMIQPLVFIIKGIVVNRIMAIIILSSIVSSLTVVYLYKIFKIEKLSEKTSILLSLIYLFTFSNIIFTSGIETYTFAAFFLVLLFYYFIKNKDKEFDNKSYVLLGILGLLSFSMTITNYIIFLIVCFTLWIFKKVKLKKLLIVGICTVAALFILNLGQRVIWNNTSVLWKLNMNEETKFMSEKKLNIKNAQKIVENDFINPIISSSIYLKVNYGSEYNDQNFVIKFNQVNYQSILL